MGSAGHVGPMFMGHHPEGSFPSLAPATGVAGHEKAVCRQWTLPIICYLCLLPLELCFWQLSTAASHCSLYAHKAAGQKCLVKAFLFPSPMKNGF